MPDRTVYDLTLLAQAGRYNLHDPQERRRSNAELAALFFVLQQRLKPDIAFEVGAYEGQFSLMMRQNNIAAVAFEANPYIFRQLSESGRFARAGVEYHHLAVAREPGTIAFNIQTKLGGISLEPGRGDNSILTRARDDVEYETVMVPSTSLDAFIKQRGFEGQAFSAWIDVEGAACPVLQGAQDSLESCLSLMIEVEQHRFWQEQWLAWDVMDFLMARDFVPVARDFEYSHQYNIVFVRKKLLERMDVRDALALYFVGSRIPGKGPL